VRGAQVDPCQVVEKKVTPRLALLALKKLCFTRNMFLSRHDKINELIATYIRALPKPLFLRHSSYVSASIHEIGRVEEIIIEGIHECRCNTSY
jgi:hypothetical protein